ncbi:MAG: hypothetical protein JSW04_00065 [Desulfobacterales bacterium]|nr:MAG: hypothetical protein JSW04_00065 [Desulfobacterales bacterium]
MDNPLQRNHVNKIKDHIRWRAVILGLVLAAAVCWVTPFNNVYRKATPLGGGHFPLAPFFVLFWLTVLIAVAKRAIQRPPLLNGKELLLVWTQTVIASGIAYTGLVRTLFINLTAPYYFASVENRWENILHPILPKAWYPGSQEAITNIYNGLSGGRQMGWWEVIWNIPWQAWLQPILSWGIFVLLCYTVMLCIVNILSSQAIYNERMNFPLLRVPQMLQQAFDENRLGQFMINRFLVAGLLASAMLHAINGLHFYFPSVPQIPTLILAGPYFPKYGLFSGFHKLKIFIYPAFIGFAFLTSKQISFSFWIFFIIGGLLFGVLSLLGYNIPGAALGVTFGPTLARPEETQMIGAYGVFFIFLAWLSRYHFINIWHKSLFSKKADLQESGWFSSAISFWIFVIGSIGIIIWLNYFGMPFWASVLVVGAFFMVTLVAMRVICQGGIAYFTVTAAPIDGLLFFWGPKFFTNIGIVVAGVAQKVLFLDLRESLMPSLLHASKVTQNSKNKRIILFGILATLVAGVVVSFVAMLALCYKFGMRELQLDWATRTTLSVYDNIFSIIEAPVRAGDWVLIFSLMGALIMLILVICFHRISWWPLHPIGYLTAYSSAMKILWFSFFVGWMCNALCMRYGGVVMFKKVRYFFMGLIIGDFLMGGGWALVGLFSDASYQVLPI